MKQGDDSTSPAPGPTPGPAPGGTPAGDGIYRAIQWLLFLDVVLGLGLAVIGLSPALRPGPPGSLGVQVIGFVHHRPVPRVGRHGRCWTAFRRRLSHRHFTAATRREVSSRPRRPVLGA